MSIWPATRVSGCGRGDRLMPCPSAAGSADRLRYYNEHRPHSTLGGPPPTSHDVCRRAPSEPRGYARTYRM